MLVDRRGSVTHVIAGDQHRLFLPELGRARAGARRFRGLRLLHTHVLGEPLSGDDLTDLSLLRLDLVATLQVGEDGKPGTVEYATLLPPDADPDTRNPWRREGPLRLDQLVHEDFSSLIAALEGEFTVATGVEKAADTRPKAILVGVELMGETGIDRKIDELGRLADTAGLNVIDRMVQKRKAVDSRHLVGKGKLEELLVRSMYLGADLLIFDRDLSPSQGRSIAEQTELKVVDRTQLILDIFAQHAMSADGRVQVELAQLKYLLPRLSMMQASLSRLAGGIGGRGPGETKLEIHQRRARDRIAGLQKRLRTLGKKRELRRSRRKRSGVPIAAIVGYTNAGKSTLLNAMTKSDAVAEDKLFATLDTTSRRMRFPDAREVVITDTVGFIERLPPALMQAFKATLEELNDADILLHVIDVSDPELPLQVRVVDEVLEELGLGKVPVLRILNKVDAATDQQLNEARHDVGGVPVSAVTREGLDLLMTELEQHLWRRGHGDVRPAWRQAEDELALVEV